MPIRSRMTSIMGQIEHEHPAYLPLNLEKLLNMTFFNSIIYKLRPISTNLSQNVCDHNISDEFDYRSNRTRIV